jgi:hypothetical protein
MLQPNCARSSGRKDDSAEEESCRAGGRRESLEDGSLEEEALRHICAWCGRDLGVNEPLDDPVVARTICTDCAERLAQYRKPVLVVSKSWARLYDELLAILKDREDIQVVLDRRDPTPAGEKDAGWGGPDRRQRGDPLALK